MLRLALAAAAASPAIATLALPGGAHAPMLAAPAQGHVGIAVAAAAANPSIQACETAGAIVDYCLDVLPTTAPVIDEANCFCCYGVEALEPDYSTCKNYIYTYQPTNTDGYSVASIVSSFCHSVSNRGFSCGGSVASATATATTTPVADTPATTVTPTATTTTPATTPAADSPAPGCSSFTSAYMSCSKKEPGFASMDDAEAASCLCYDNGVYTTLFDDYISECADWARTGDPSVYETYVYLETFCEFFPPETTVTSGMPTATFSNGRVTGMMPTATFGSSAADTPSSSSTQTTVTVTSVTSVATAGRSAVNTGIATWLATLLALLF